MRIRSVLGHSFQAILEGALIALIVVGMVAGTALAAKSARGGGSISVVALQSTDGVPHQGQDITFNYSTSNAYPVVSLSCSKNGAVVYGNSGPMYWPNMWDFDGVFTLASQAWSEGAADCRADLKGTQRGKTVLLASTTFHVEP